MKKHLPKFILGTFAFIFLIPLAHQWFWWNLRLGYKAWAIGSTWAS